MEKPKIDLEGLQKLELPNMQKTIDYCRLHATTGKEGYRRLAIDSFRGSDTFRWLLNTIVPQSIEEFYPMITEYLEVSEDEVLGGMNEIIEQLRTPIDMEKVKEWREYCLGCKEPCKSCDEERRKLESFQENNRERLETMVSKVIKVIKSALDPDDDYESIRSSPLKNVNLNG